MEPIKTYNKRCLEVMDFVINNKIKGIETETHFLETIGYSSTSNIRYIRSGLQGFRVEHISNICEVFGVDANFILKTKHQKMFKNELVQEPLELLKEAVIAVKNQITQLKDEAKNPIKGSNRKGQSENKALKSKK